jgi:Sec-independent protein translocase protein TatA
MNFGGMGTLEVLFILLIAFIFLGPQRLSEAAKTLGKFVREIRRMTADLPDLVLEEDDKSARQPVSTRRSSRTTPERNTSRDKEPPENGDAETVAQDGPVAFRPGSPAQQEESGQAPSVEERQ